MVAALYFGREVLVPVALAVMVTFLLAPAVRRLERLRFPRVAAVTIAVSCATLFVGGVGWIVERQVVELADKLPEYKTNILDKVKGLRPSVSGVLGRTGKLFTEMGHELTKPVTTPGDPPEVAETAPPPTPVKVIAEPTPPLTYLKDLLGPVLSRLAMALVVIVFATFMLVYREDLRSRLITLIGEREIHVTTPALDDAAQRVSRYLVMQSMSNAAAGLVIGVGMFLLGIPNAPLWGLVIALLRFVPYVGVWIAAALPLTLSLALSPGWTQPLSTLALIVAVEIALGNFIEPLLFSSGTGLSPLAVLAAAVFWAWLWGPVGLLLSTPLTVCLAVLGRHVPKLRYL
ncbi:MAG: AI-2E family transporter, partial [Phycisphaerae bacterium]|nr:AI-2E family transporter [Gemmatimonadaceae bacterium]